MTTMKNNLKKKIIAMAQKAKAVYDQARLEEDLHGQ